MSALRLILCALFVFPVTTLHAQWAEVYSLDSYVFALTVSDANLFAGSDEEGVFLSPDDGANWTAVNNGLTDLRVHSIAVKGADLFAGTLGGVFLSTDNGANWMAVNNGLTNLAIYPLAVIGSNLFAGTSNSGVFLSGDDGASWTAVNNGLTNLEVSALAVRETTLFAGTNGGVFLSTDNGANWTPVNSGLTNSLVTALAVSGENLFAGTFGGGVFHSADDGASWTAVNTGLTDPNLLSLLAVDDENLLAGTFDSGIFISHDNGASWTEINTGLTKLSILSLAATDSYLYAGTRGDAPNSVWRRARSEVITSIEKTTSNEIPDAYSLRQNYPNPFNPTTTIEFAIPAAGRVSIDVFNALGQVVDPLVDEELQPGQYRTTWDASGLPSGVYYYRIQAGSYSESRKLVLLR